MDGDPTHSRKRVNELNLYGAKGAVTFGFQGNSSERPTHWGQFDPLVIRWKAADPRVQGISAPRVPDEAQLHRAVRYIAGTPVWVRCFVGGVVLGR